jgi:uncharacterized protein (UPF0212 family)
MDEKEAVKELTKRMNRYHPNDAITEATRLAIAALEAQALMTTKDNFVPDEMTRCVDEGICPHCGQRFDAARAINYDISLTQFSDCPNCGKEIEIFASVEYHCSVPEED